MKTLKRMFWTGWIRTRKVLEDTRGISTIELILVLVVIIGLVLIFKSQLTSLVNSIFDKITDSSSAI